MPVRRRVRLPLVVEMNSLTFMNVEGLENVGNGDVGLDFGKDGLLERRILEGITVEN